MIKFKEEVFIVSDIGEKEEQKSFEVNETVHVTWNLKSSSFVISDKEMKTKKKCKHNDNLIAIGKINNDLFFTISKDNIVKTWKGNGDLYGIFENHSKKIMGMEILYDGILSISKNDTICFWSFNGDEKYSIDLKIDSLDKIKINSDLFQVIDTNELSIYNIYNGNKIMKFKSKKEFINSNKFLNSGKMLTKDNAIVLWNENGDEVKKLDFKFDFKNLIETEDSKIIILTKELSIVILDENGNTLSDYTPPKETIDSFTDFIKGRVKLEEEKKHKNKIEQFYHLFNPYEKGIIADKEIIEQKLDFEKSHNKLMWNFFNRPIWRKIKELLNKEEKEAKIYKNIFNTSVDSIEDTILQKTKQLKKSESKNGINLVLAGILLAVGVFVGIAINPIGYAILVAAAIMFFMYASKQSDINKLKLDIKTLENQICTIAVVYPEINKFIEDIKKYRTVILKQLPIFSNPNIYDGKEVKKIMNELIESKLNTVALEYCGLVQDDIVHAEKKAIVINNGSLLQINTGRINIHNLKSFWQTEDGSILFAVQYIQYIFLTVDKIDIFSAHYDFIQDKFINKEAQAFYYKDVTNISKKEVERELLGENTKALATEIALKVSSGDKIEFTIFNNDTLSELNANTKDIPTNFEEIEELEIEYKEIENSKEYDSEEEKKEELDYISKQIKSLKANGSLDETIKFSTDEVNMSIQNIRAQIKKHKN